MSAATSGLWKVNANRAADVPPSVSKTRPPGIAGVNKRVAVPALVEKAEHLGVDFFDFIKFDYTFEKDECGKLLHSYVDEPRKGVLTDFRGVRGRYEEQSYIHLEPTTYKMTATNDYLELLMTYAGDYVTYIG